jgi:polyhydroxyalkanoate synthesis regulator phasin
MNRILDHDHSELDTLLQAAFAALADGAVDRAFESLDVFWARLAVHIRAENARLFPALLRAAETATPRPHAPPHDEIVDTIARLRVDHDFFMVELTAAMKALRELRGNVRPVTASAIAELRERLEQVSDRLVEHNALEETRAYRWVSVLLDQPEQENLVDRIRRELENVPARLRKKLHPQRKRE